MKPLIIDEEAELELAGSVAFYEDRRRWARLRFPRRGKGGSEEDSDSTRTLASGKARYETLRHEQVPVCYSLHRHARQTLGRGIRPRKAKARILD